jgi:hypothetical protein
MDTPFAALELILASQLGLVTLDQMRANSLTDNHTRWLIRRKTLRRVRPRVFALVGAAETWERGLLAAVLSVEGAIASHSSAARLWRFDPRPEDRYEITVGREHRPTLRGVVIHRSGTVGEQDIVRRDGIPCASFERTVSDCSTLLTGKQLGYVLDDGLRRGVASLNRLKNCSERTESSPGRHMTVVRTLLAARGIGFDPGGSRAELDVLEVFRRAGIPMPVQQHRVNVGSKSYRPDFAWPDQEVFAEYYGMAFHSGVSATVSDNARVTALSAAGWAPLVFTYASSDGEIIERTTEALQKRGLRWETGV